MTRLLVMLWLILGLSGCMEYGYKMNELHGLNCRPEALVDGKCVSTKAAAQQVTP